MTVPYQRPNFPSQDATTYKTNIDETIQAHDSYAGQFYVKATTPFSRDIIVQGGIIIGGESVAEQTLSIAVSNPSLGRIDAVSIDTKTGVAVVTTGTPDETPVFPSYPSGNFLLAKVLVPATQETVQNTSIVDVRSFTSVSGNSGDTYSLLVSDPISESTSGNATNQQVVNQENKTTLTAITEALEKLQNVSMVIDSSTPFNAGSGDSNPVRWDFNIVTPSTNEDVLSADASANYIDFKIEGVRYLFSGEAQVTKGSAQDKIMWVQLRKQSDNSPIGNASQIAVNWANGETRAVTLTGAIDTPEPNYQLYYAVWATRTDGTTPDSDVIVESVTNSIQSQGSGASAGKWQDSTLGGNKILQTVEKDYVSVISGNPENYAGVLGQHTSVIGNAEGDSLVVTGSDGGTQDGTYEKELTQDQFGFSFYKRTNPSILYISKDDSPSHPYWCVSNIVNPVFFNADYYYNGATPDGEYVNPLNPTDTCSVSLQSGATGTGYATNGDIVTYGNVIVNGSGISLQGQGLIGWVQNQSGDYLMAFNVSEASGNNEVLYSFGSDFVPRFSIPASGPGKTTQMYRSVALGGYIIGNENSTDDTDSANLSFDSTFLDFNTGTAGNEAKPDLGVAGAMQVKDGILIGEDQSTDIVIQNNEIRNSDQVWKLLFDGDPATQFTSSTGGGIDVNPIILKSNSINATYPTPLMGKMRLTMTYDSGGVGQAIVNLNCLGVSTQQTDLSNLPFATFDFVAWVDGGFPCLSSIRKFTNTNSTDTFVQVFCANTMSNLKIEVLGESNLALADNTADVTGFSTETINVAASRFAYANDGVVSGMTTADTAEENINLGDQGLVSYGGLQTYETVTITEANGWTISSADVRAYPDGSVCGGATFSGSGTGLITDGTTIGTYDTTYSPFRSVMVADAYVLSGGTRTPFTVLVKNGTISFQLTASVALSNTDTIVVSYNYKR